MSDDAPPWLEVMRAITGLTETPGSDDNPKIMAMPRFIAYRFPEQSDYCDLYTGDDVAWCGLTAAFCMAVCDISGPFGKTDTDKWMWALSWSDDDNYTHIDKPKLGCVVVMERSGGGHVTFYEETDSNGNYRCRGGNQSDMVNVSSYDPDTVVALVWPKTQPTPPATPAQVDVTVTGDAKVTVNGELV